MMAFENNINISMLKISQNDIKEIKIILMQIEQFNLICVW